MRACEVGADTLYGVSYRLVPNSVEFESDATLALRKSSVPTAATRPVDPVCSPICSPGFDCRAGQCIPLCNPDCGPTRICGRQRTCEPKESAPRP